MVIVTGVTAAGAPPPGVAGAAALPPPAGGGAGSVAHAASDITNTIAISKEKHLESFIKPLL